MTECESRSFLQSLLDRVIRVELSDDRVVVGRLACIDNYGNLIIEDSIVHNADVEQHIASVMVPGKHVIKLGIS